MSNNQLSSAFGGLSLSAREWKPPQHQQPQENQNSKSNGSHGPSQSQQQRLEQDNNSAEWPPESELNAATVKEFVPGKGWAAQAPVLKISSPSNSSGMKMQARGSWNPTQPGVPVPGSNGYQFQHTGQQANGAVAFHHMSQPKAQEQPYQETTIPSGPPPPPPSFRSLHAMGLPDEIWRMHREISAESSRQMEPTDPRHKAIPMPFCNGFCLDAPCRPGARRRSSFGYHCDTFQVTSREDGFQYCLRRFDSVKSVSPKIAATVMDRWSKVEPHPGLVQPIRCFLAQRAVFFVHQFIPGARSMKERVSMTGPLPENVLWSSMTQMVAVLRRVHSANLAVRTIDMAHTLVKSDASQLRLRLFFNCAAVVDTLEFESRKNMKDLQVEDIRSLGRLMLSMATGTELTSATDKETWAQCDQFCVQTYSRELHNLCFTLVRSPIPPNIVDVSRVLANRAFDELDIAHQSLDTTEVALSAEYESGRALRLLLKMGFINERPEFGPNRRWAQSGDNYVLSLFRDYVFHQADGAGNPVMDLGHVVTALNKLDAADEEQIVLMSRDGKTLMVVSYADVARCLETAYHELCNGSIPPSALRY